MLTLIPDTNFLIYLVKYKLLDELENYKLIIIPQIIEELEKLSKDKKKKMEDRIAASVAIMFLKNSNAKIEKATGKTDAAILKVAKKLKKIGAKIGTMDKELSLKAEKLNIDVIKIRQKKYLI